MKIPRRVLLLLIGPLTLAVLWACAEPQRRHNLPPSASDLVLLKSVKLCDARTAVLQRHRDAVRRPWGAGEELSVAGHGAEAESSYYFDQDGTLVGAVFTFPAALDLKPYRVLRRTLSELRPSLEFYLNASMVPGQANLDPTTLYETGDASSTTQYLVLAASTKPRLLLASFAIDPYAKLLSPYRAEFLSRVQSPDRTGSKAMLQGAEDKESFLALQQFARGEAAHFGSCGTRDNERAAEAYAAALAQGFSNKVWQGEAQHKLGLALEAIGKLAEAKRSLEQSLITRPNNADVYNTLGTVQARLGDQGKAIEAFERAIVLRPNYSIARFNLAEAYESLNAKRAISEYETYLALAEGIVEEESRVAVAQQRIKALKK